MRRTLHSWFDYLSSLGFGVGILVASYKPIFLPAAHLIAGHQMSLMLTESSAETTANGAAVTSTKDLSMLVDIHSVPWGYATMYIIATILVVISSICIAVGFTIFVYGSSHEADIRSPLFLVRAIVSLIATVFGLIGGILMMWNTHGTANELHLTSGGAEPSTNMWFILIGAGIVLSFTTIASVKLSIYKKQTEGLV